MNEISNSIIFPMLITVFPILLTYYRGDKSTYLKISIWSILSLVFSLILFKVISLNYNLTITIISILISTLINICFLKEWINSKSFLKLLAILCIFFFGSIFQLIPIWLFNLDINNLSSSQDVYLTLFSDLIILTIILFLYRKELTNQFMDFKKNFYKYIDMGFKYWLIGLIIMVISNLLIISLSPNSIATNEQQVQTLIGSAPFISLICVGIIAPIIEEFTFRKSFYDAFNNKWLFILASGLIFGGLHVILSLNSLWDLLYLIPYCSLGIAFAYTMNETKNIFSVVLVHAFHNTCLTFLSIASKLIIMGIML